MANRDKPLICSEICGGPLDGEELQVNIRKDCFPPATLRLLKSENKFDPEIGMHCPIRNGYAYVLDYYLFRCVRYGFYVWDGIRGDRREVEGRIFRILRRIGVDGIDESKIIPAPCDIPKRKLARLKSEPTVCDTWKCTAYDQFDVEICSLEYWDKLLLEPTVAQMAKRALAKSK